MTKFPKIYPEQCQKTKIILIISIFFFGIFGLAKISQAATLYVCPSGCQYSTIQAAANVVNPGDTVIVRNGTYNLSSGEVGLLINRAGTSSNWITFKSENLWGAVLNGNNTNMCVMFYYNAAYIRFEGFEIKNCHNDVQGDGLWVNADDQQDCNAARAHDIYLYHLKIHDIARITTSVEWGNSAIDGDDCTYNVTIDSCVFYNIGRLNPNTTPSAPESSCISSDGVKHCYGHDHAIYFRGSYYTVINNVIYPEIKSGYAIDMLHKYHNPHDIKIINNTIYGFNEEKNGVVTFSFNGHDNIIIQNNIFYGAHNWAVNLVNSGDTNVFIRNNLVYNAPISSNCDGTRGICSNNIIGQDPKFVNLALKDFHLQSSSPAINKGLAYSGRTVDADGKSILGLPDIGAYEYGGGTSDTTAPAAPTGLKVN